MAAKSKEMEIAIKIAGKVESSFKNALGQAAKGLKSITKTVAAASVAAAVAIAGLGAAAIDAGIEYESAFAGVKKTIDATDEQLQVLDEGIREMSTRMPTAAAEIAGVAEAAGQLGIETDNVLGFTETMVQLGDATNLTANEAATTLARFANVTGMAQTDFDRLGSSIVALGNNYATTESEIAGMAQNLSSAGTQVGMSEAQILGFSAALSSVGLEAAAGGTAMSKLMINMQVATEKGGDSLAEFANVAGMSSEEFKNAFQEDAAGAIISFVTGLNDTERLGKSAIAVLDDMDISETRLRDTILRAAGAGDMFTAAIETSTEAWEENVALSNEAEQRYATMESQVQILKNGLTNLGIEFYQNVRNPMADVIETANGWIQTMTSAFQTGGLDGLVSSLGGILSEAVLMVADYAPGIVGAGVNVLESFINGITESSGTIADTAAEVLSIFINGLFTLIPQVILAGIDIILQLAQSLTTQLPQLMDNGTQAIVNFVAGIIQRLPEVATTALSLVQTLVTGIGNNVPMLISSAIQLIGGLLLGIVQMLPELCRMGIQLLMSLAEGLVANLPLLLQVASQVITSLILGIGQMLPEIIQSGIQIIITLLQGIISNLGNIAQAAEEIVLALITGLIQAIPALIGGVFQLRKAIIDTIMETDWLQVGIDILNGIINGIKSMGKNLWNAIKSLFKGDGEDIDVSEAGRTATESYAQGIENNAGAASGAVNMLSMSAFNGVDYTSATEAGAYAGEAFTSGLTDGMEGFTLDSSTIGMDMEALTENMNLAGIDGMEALSSGISDNSDMVMGAVETLGNDTTAALDDSWRTAESSAKTAMGNITQTVTTAAQAAANAVKSAFENLAITIPKPKIPVISVAYNTETYGEGGSVKVPKFDVSWNALGGIFMKPTILGSSAGAQGVGEAGAEAILPLDTLWKQMQQIVGDAVKRNSGASIVETLLEKLQGIGSRVGVGSRQPQLAGAGGPDIVYSPTYNLYGSATKEDAVEVEKMSRAEFRKMMKQYEKENNRRKW